MDESTTTDPIMPGDGAEESAQPVQQNESAATQATEPTTNAEDDTSSQGQEPGNEPDNSDGPSEYATLKEWADKKGYDLTTEEGQARAFKSMREAEQRMHQSTAKASELERTLADPVPPAPQDDQQQPDVIGELASEVRQLKQAQTIQTFFGDGESGAERKAYEQKMAEMVTQDQNLKALVNSGYLSLEQLYQMAKGADPTHEQTLKSEGGRAALEKLASKQQGKAVPGNASSSDLGGDAGQEDPFLAGMNKVN